MNSEFDAFLEEMKKQLNLNGYKGDYKKYKDLNNLLYQIEYHKAKLLFAIKQNDKEAITEYSADCANLFAFLGIIFGQDIHLNKENTKQKIIKIKFE